jgi:hypothetical protein
MYCMGTAFAFSHSMQLNVFNIGGSVTLTITWNLFSILLSELVGLLLCPLKTSETCCSKKLTLVEYISSEERLTKKPRIRRMNDSWNRILLVWMAKVQKTLCTWISWNALEGLKAIGKNSHKTYETKQVRMFIPENACLVIHGTLLVNRDGTMF